MGLLSFFALAARALHFFCPNKRNEAKKIRGSRSEAKIFTFFLKKKNSLTLKQLFLLHGKQQKFLHASPLDAGTHRRTQMRFAVWGGSFFSLVKGNNILDDTLTSPLWRGLGGCSVRMASHVLWNIPLPPFIRGRHKLQRAKRCLRYIHSWRFRPLFFAVKRRCFSER